MILRHTPLALSRVVIVSGTKKVYWLATDGLITKISVPGFLLDSDCHTPTFYTAPLHLIKQLIVKKILFILVLGLKIPASATEWKQFRYMFHKLNLKDSSLSGNLKPSKK